MGTSPVDFTAAKAALAKNNEAAAFTDPDLFKYPALLTLVDTYHTLIGVHPPPLSRTTRYEDRNRVSALLIGAAAGGRPGQIAAEAALAVDAQHAGVLDRAEVMASIGTGTPAARSLLAATANYGR
jgi:hypothetical protein